MRAGAEYDAARGRCGRAPTAIDIVNQAGEKSERPCRRSGKYSDCRSRALSARTRECERTQRRSRWPKAGSERLCARALMAMDGENQAVYRRAMHLCARANTTFAGAHCERESTSEQRRRRRPRAGSERPCPRVGEYSTRGRWTARVVVPVGTCASQAYEKHEI